MSNTPTNPRAKRHWGDDDSQTNILHIDMDSFYAQVELHLHPELRGRPVIVAGRSARGVVTSATYEARALGVKAGMPTMQARALVPHAAVTMSPHHVYEEYSARVMEVIARFTPVFEQISIDEAFIDVSGSRRRLGSPVQIGQMLRREIRQQTDLPASVGIAAVKSIAKIASAHAKPDGLLLIPAEQSVAFLHSLPVGALWGVGGVTQQKLRIAGVETIADVAHMPRERLKRLVGQASAYQLRNLAWGIDPRSVAPREKEKSISTERTFEDDIRDPAHLERFILEASHECARRLRAAGWVAWTVGIKVRDAARTTVTRSVTLSSPTDLGGAIAEAARQLLSAYGVPRGGVRLMGVKVENLQSRAEGVAVTLDDDGHASAAERAMDAVRARFGSAALRPGSLVDQGRSEAGE